MKSLQQSQAITQSGLQHGQQYMIGKDFLLRDSGLYYLTKDQQSGKTKANRIAEPLFVKETIRNIDSQVVYLNLLYKYKGSYDELKISRRQIIPKELLSLTDSGVDVPHEYNKMLSTYLREQQVSAPHKVMYLQTGWHKNESNKWKFRHHEILPSTKSQITEYDEERGIYKLEPSGDLEVWMDMVKEHVLGHTPLEVALVIGFSAPIVGYLSQVLDGIESLMFHYVGDSTSGKSTASGLGVSIFGAPSKKDKGLIKSWNGTSNAIINNLGGNFGIPVVLDELSMSEAKSLTSELYVMTSGVEKARLSDEIKQRNRGQWSTTIISNGEQSTFDRTNKNQGLVVRVTEFENEEWTKSGKHADDILEVIHYHYGHAGVKFIEYLFSVGLEEIKKQWKKWQVRLERSLPLSEYRSRIAKKHAIILAATTFANQALNLNLNENAIEAFLVEHEKEMLPKRDLEGSAYQKMKQVVLQYQGNFRVDGEYSIPQNCWGKIFYHNDFIEIAIYKHILEQQLRELGFDNPNVITHKWKDKGYLNIEGDRKTKRVRIFTAAEQEERKKALGVTTLPAKLEDTTYNLKIPKEELQGMFARRRVVGSFCNDPDIEKVLD